MPALTFQSEILYLPFGKNFMWDAGPNISVRNPYLSFGKNFMWDAVSNFSPGKSLQPF
jgi:hypothetical protein